ncbi:MAG: MOSC domain-containing protein [Sulfurimonas sp.]|nr:MAG: MOSC domain-containing protein [Sulfurimonas sp.]
MSKEKVGLVLKLFVSISGISTRKNKTSIILNKLGVQGDKFYNKDLERSILISSIDSYKLMKKRDINMPLGYLGENILIDYNPYKLEIGTKIKIGDTILEISQNCTICNHLASIDKNIPELLKNDRGIFAKVIQGGKINFEDEVYIV